MVVIFHILVALLGIAFATLTFFRPYRLAFRATYILIAVTLGSGLYMAWMVPAKMLHVCVSGIVYTIVVSVITIFARIRFTKLQKGGLHS